MKQYFTFFKMRFIAGLQYRVAALAGMSTQLVWGAMEILLYRAFYLEYPERFPMGLQALVSYIWLQQAFLSLFFAYAWENELFEAARTGTVAYELVRPVNIYGMWCARSFALRLSRAALRAIPVILVGALIPSPYGLRLTISPGVFWLFILSTGMMLWVAVALVMILYGASFHMTYSAGLNTLMAALMELFSGSIVPLPFFPAGLRTVAELSPFGAMQNVPLRIFGGDILPTQIPGYLGLQLFWVVVLTALGYLLIQTGLRRCTVAGG